MYFSFYNASIKSEQFYLFLFLIEVEWCLEVKEYASSAGDSGSIPGLGRSPGDETGKPLQYFCLGNPLTQEPGGLQPMGSQEVRHDLATKQQHG